MKGHEQVKVQPELKANIHRMIQKLQPAKRSGTRTKMLGKLPIEEDEFLDNVTLFFGFLRLAFYNFEFFKIQPITF